MIRRALPVLTAVLSLGLGMIGCSDQMPAQSGNSTGTISNGVTQPVVQAQPGYEPAYYDGDTVTINAIELSQHAPEQAQADFWEVVYPIGWEDMGLPAPQCNPCDHEGNGIDFTDYHDHVLDSIPSSPGHGEYRGLWHVYLVLPAYTGDTDHDAAVGSAYAAMLPATSEDAVNALLQAELPDGSPVAAPVNTDFYFLCAVVNQHAQP
jgi:hypothetical protein